MIEDFKVCTFAIDKFFNRIFKERPNMVFKSFEQINYEKEDAPQMYRAKLMTSALIQVFKHCKSAVLNGWEVKDKQHG